MKTRKNFCNEMSENLDFINGLINELKNTELSKGKTETSILSELMIVINQCYDLAANKRDEATNTK